MPRHCHEGAEEAIQGLSGLLLQECKSVSDGWQGLGWGKDCSERCHSEVVVGGWAGEVPGEALVNLLGKGAGQWAPAALFWALGQKGMGCPEPDFEVI